MYYMKVERKASTHVGIAANNFQVSKIWYLTAVQEESLEKNMPLPDNDTFLFMDIDQHVRELLKSMSEGVYEKEHILAMSLLSAVAGESIFLLGPPGTAKSLVARKLKMIFKNGSAFEYLMSRFSTPDEIFGPVSISLLKNEDR